MTADLRKAAQDGQTEQGSMYFGLTNDCTWLSITQEQYEKLKLEGRLKVYEAPPSREWQSLNDEKAAMQDAINSIYVYANDTLSGRTDGPDDRAWYRAGVVELRNRARALATISSAVDARAALRKKNSGEQA